MKDDRCQSCLDVAEVIAKSGVISAEAIYGLIRLAVHEHLPSPRMWTIPVATGGNIIDIEVRDGPG